jgi:tetratricopeptide (TPR) repeat protein
MSRGHCRAWNAAFALACLVLGIQACTPQPKMSAGCDATTAEEWSACGDRDYSKGNYQAAIASFNEALKRDPQYLPALFDRANAELKLRNYDAVIRDMDAFLQAKPESAKAHNLRGSALTNQARYDAAVKEFDEAQRLDPASCPDACYNRGYAHYAAGDYSAAIADFKSVLDIHPDDNEALLMRGRCYRFIGNYDAALEDFAAVIRLKPDDVGAYANRSTVYVLKGDYPAARAESEKALAIDPTYADAYYNIAEGAYRNGNFQDAVSAYSDAIRFYTEAAEGPSERVSHWFRTNNYSEYWPPGSQVRKIDRYLADSYYWRSRAYLKLGDEAHAKEDLAAAKRLDPTVATRLEDSI